MFDVWSYLVIHLALGIHLGSFHAFSKSFPFVGQFVQHGRACSAAIIGVTLEDLSPKCAVPDCIFFTFCLVLT